MSFNVSSVPATTPASMSTTATYQAMVTNYSSVGALAVLIWDILDNLPTDFRMFFGGKNWNWSIAMLAYFSARIAGLGYILGDVIYSTAPTGTNCATFSKAVNAWCTISLSSTAFLFFLRLRAIYNRNRIVISAFYVLWLALLASAIMVPIGIDGGPMPGNPRYCEDIHVAQYTQAAQVFPLVFDTLVFMAITWRLSRIAAVETGVGENIMVMFSGKNLPKFSKTLLVDGQIYYLITIAVGLPFVTLNFAKSVPAPLQVVMEGPYLVLVNIMACRVYRNTRTGLIRESEISSTSIHRSQGDISSPIPIGLASSSASSVENKGLQC